MRDIKESYGHMRQISKAGEVEKSQFKVSKNPHQEILDKLMSRPFLKHKVMTSNSVKNFIFDIFEDGLNEDMVIFEPNFVKRYPHFSTEFLDLHFHYNSAQSIGHNNDLDFISTYDKIVLPKRWQKPYQELQDRYSQQTKDLIFCNPHHQAELFKQQNQKKPFQVFTTKSNNRYKKNMIIQSIKLKIQQQLLLKSDHYHKSKLEQFKERKNQRLDQEQNLELPDIGIDQKKQLLIQDMKAKKLMKRVYSEAILQRQMDDTSVLGSMINKNKETETIEAFKNELSRNSYKQDLKANDSADSELKALQQSLNPNQSKFKRNTSQLPIISTRNYQSRVESFRSGNSQNRQKDGQNKRANRPSQEFSDEVKKHVEITSQIYSLKNIINKLKVEKSRKFPDYQKIEDQVHMAIEFLERLHENYEHIKNDKLRVLAEEVIARIDNLLYQTQEKIEAWREQEEKFKEHEKEITDPEEEKRRKQLHRIFKADLLQKLSLIEYQSNQLKNTDNKYKKFYEKNQREQLKEKKDFLKTQNAYMANMNHLNHTRVTKNSIINRSTQDTTNILNNLNINETQDTQKSIIQNQINARRFQLNVEQLNQDSAEFNESSIIDNNNQDLDSFRKQAFIQDPNSHSLGIIQESSPAKSFKRRPTLSKSPSKKMHQQQLDDLLKKKGDKTSFNRLVGMKDFSEVNQKIDVMKQVKKYLDEMNPYQFYDEVIDDYFGGNFKVDILMKQKQEENKQDDDEQDKEEEDKKKKEVMRQAVVQQTLDEMMILAKEDAMTHLKAIKSIQNHVQNEKKLNFKQKQEKSTLKEYLKQLPNKDAKQKQSSDHLDDYYDYEQTPTPSKPTNQLNIQESAKPQPKLYPLAQKMQTALRTKVSNLKKKQVGIEDLPQRV